METGMAGRRLCEVNTDCLIEKVLSAGASLEVNGGNLVVKRKQGPLADYLLEEAGVALLPGTAFGKLGDGYLRLSYANSLENIREALARMNTAIAKIR